MRLIDADRLETHEQLEPFGNGNYEYVEIVYKDDIDDAPTIEPERKTGKWIKLDMHAHLADHKCTACGQECYVPTCMGEPMYTYCPNCGADMRGREDE